MEIKDGQTATVQLFNEKPAKSVPQTGDDYSVYLWAGLMLLSMIGSGGAVALCLCKGGKYLDDPNVAFGQPQMQTLKIVSADGVYTNLGLLLSEQCPHTTKAAVFEGTNQNVFKDRREFSGSLMQQLNEVYDYIDFHNQTHATFQKLLRIDTRDYPEVAVRGALLNSLVHRDYSFHASTLISIYEDRIEFVSIGGLLPGLELDDLMMGISVCRNPHLANVFYRLQLIEAYGTDMKKIMGAYADAPVQPKITTTNNAFKITLPNVNAVPKEAEAPEETEKAIAPAADSNEEKILRFLAEHQVITRKKTQALLGVSQSTAGRILKAMVDNGQIKQFGGSRTTRYELSKK